MARQFLSGELAIKIAVSLDQPKASKKRAGAAAGKDKAKTKAGAGAKEALAGNEPTRKRKGRPAAAPRLVEEVDEMDEMDEMDELVDSDDDGFQAVKPTQGTSKVLLHAL